jgi:hypothetical protein
MLIKISTFLSLFFPVKREDRNVHILNRYINHVIFPPLLQTQIDDFNENQTSLKIRKVT